MRPTGNCRPALAERLTALPFWDVDLPRGILASLLLRRTERATSLC